MNAGKLKRIASFALAGIYSCAALTGCAAGRAQHNASGVVTVAALEAKALQAPTYGEENSAATAAAHGANEFAFRLGAALAEEAGAENFVCSPYSVWLPLAALVNATDDQNRQALLEALCAVGISTEDLNSAVSRMLYDLTRQREKEWAQEYDQTYHNPLTIANAIFVDQNVTLNPTFAQTFLDYYRGNMVQVNFTSQDAVEAVNQWASEHTNGLIPQIVQQFDPDTVAAIANAIYFSDRWNWEFDPQRTAEDIFHSPSGDTTAFYMLRQGDGLSYYEDNQVQAMPLSFTTGGGLYIILPKDGDAAGLLSSMTNQYFEEIQAGSNSATGKLLLPRFSIESGAMQLKNILLALGVPLFNDEMAPLTGGLIEGDIPVWLSSAAHKALIEVDERGTTAAAVTVMAANAASAAPGPTQPFEMICNRPFVFVLYAHTYDGGNQVLFTGMVNQP